jgi:hypothetical protein
MSMHTVYSQHIASTAYGTSLRATAILMECQEYRYIALTRVSRRMSWKLIRMTEMESISANRLRETLEYLKVDSKHRGSVEEARGLTRRVRTEMGNICVAHGSSLFFFASLSLPDVEAFDYALHKLGAVRFHILITRNNIKSTPILSLL